MEFYRKSLLISSCTAVLSAIGDHILNIDAGSGGANDRNGFFIPIFGLSCLFILMSCSRLLGEYRSQKVPRPSRPDYHYPEGKLTIFVLAALVLSSIVLFLFGIFSDAENSWVFAVAVAPGGVLFAVTLKASLHYLLRIEPGETGICAVTITGERREIRWSEVERIEQIKKTRTGQIFGFRVGYKYVVVGRDYQIPIEDDISRLHELVKALNARIREFGIPLVGYDRTDEGRKIAKADPAVRASAESWVDGINMPITELTYAE